MKTCHVLIAGLFLNNQRMQELAQVDLKIEAKKAEIANYSRILDEYGPGRWRNLGFRRLAELLSELSALQQAVDLLPRSPIGPD
jgi:hypothetical protein